MEEWLRTASETEQFLQKKHPVFLIHKDSDGSQAYGAARLPICQNPPFLLLRLRTGDR